MALWVDRRESYVTNVIDGLEAGQIIVIATDGIFEARDHHGDMFGHARLKDTIRRYCTESARQIVDRVFDAVAAHVEDLPPEDDRTLVVIKHHLIST